MILAKQKLKTSNDTGKMKGLEKIGDYCASVGASYQAIEAYQKCVSSSDWTIRLIQLIWLVKLSAGHHESPQAA